MSPEAEMAMLVGRSKAFGPAPPTPGVPRVISTLPSGLSFSTSWPITTPALFVADIPRIVG